MVYLGYSGNKKAYLISVLICIFLLSIVTTSVKAESKTGLVIITSLDDFKYMTPALTENNSYVYNNFEFRLYTSENNTYYSIEVDQIMISNGTINHFNKTIYWKCKQSFISSLKVNIGNDVYEYSAIRVFTTDIVNDTIVNPPDQIVFTESELKDYLKRMANRIFSGDSLGWFFGFVLSMYGSREYLNRKMIEK
jgi:hypothetical protein